MSDYMFMLESHLSADQNRVVAAVQAKAADAGVNLFLAGGAMRDMLGGFRLRDLDFVVEGNAVKIARSIPETRVVSIDENRRSAELIFPGGVPAQIAMARTERYSRPGAKPQVASATIQEDLRCRDFTIDAIALSLARASRGLLLDPMNGLADLQNRELRTVTPYVFYDDPSRLLRFVRLRTRLGFEPEPRTAGQYANAREQKLESYIGPRLLGEELQQIAAETNPAEVMEALGREGLATLFSPELEGPKLNLAGLAKLEKLRRLLPPGAEPGFDTLAPFLWALTEKMPPKEKQALVARTALAKPEADAWLKLPAHSRKLETALKSPTLRRPSQVYQAVAHAGGDQVVFLLYHSESKTVQDRLRNYLQKYLPTALEVQDSEVQSSDPPGSPKFLKAKEDLIAKRLNARPKPPEPEPVPPPPPPPDAPRPLRRELRR